MLQILDQFLQGTDQRTKVHHDQRKGHTGAALVLLSGASAGLNKEKYKESTDRICGEYKLVLLHHVVIRVQMESFPSRLARKQQDPRIDWLVFTSS